FLAAMIVGIPAALIVYVGWPLPSTVPTWETFAHAMTSRSIDLAVTRNILAVLLWIVWLRFVVATADEAIYTIRTHERRPREDTTGLSRQLAAFLVGAVILVQAARQAPRSNTPAAATAMTGAARATPVALLHTVSVYNQYRLVPDPPSVPTRRTSMLFA